MGQSEVDVRIDLPARGQGFKFAVQLPLIGQRGPYMAAVGTFQRHTAMIVANPGDFGQLVWGEPDSLQSSQFINLGSNRAGSFAQLLDQGWNHTLHGRLV